MNILNLELELDSGGIVTTDMCEIEFPFEPEVPRTPVSFEKNTVHFSRRKTGDKEYEVIGRVRQKPEGSFYEEGDFHGSWVTLEVHKNHDDAIAAIKRLRS